MSENSRPLRSIYFLLILIVPVLLWSQEDEFLNGLVLDSNDRSPVPFATVKVKGRAVGVITNSDGSFRIPDHFRSLGDSIEVSSLGYRTRSIAISSWDRLKTKIISLDLEIEALDEVVVTAQRRRLNAIEIISKALHYIPNNYPASPYSYIGYYRDYQIIDDDYVNLNEAILQIYDRGFHQNDYETTGARILRLNKNMLFHRDSTTSIPYNYQEKSKTIPNAHIESYAGNELVILRLHDAIRNHSIDSYSYVNKLMDDFIPNHQFIKKGLLNYKGDFIYRILIKKEDSDTRIRGEIYVSATDFGIIKMDYQVFLLESKEVGNTVKQVERPLYGVLVEYDRRDKYYLNYLSFRNYFEVTPPPIFYVKSMAVDKKKRLFELEFSTVPRAEDASKAGNYKLSYYGQKIKIESVSLGKDGKTVAIYPTKSFKQDQVLALINEGDFVRDEFEIKFRKLRDIDGNHINKSVSTGVEQFRELFVQQIVEDPEIPSDSQLMSKSLPLFGEQPLFQGELSENFWMNTPLIK